MKTKLYRKPFETPDNRIRVQVVEIYRNEGGRSNYVHYDMYVPKEAVKIDRKKEEIEVDDSLFESAAKKADQFYINI